MPLKNVPKNKCVSFSDAWGSAEKEPSPSGEQRLLDLHLLTPFPEHKFKLYQGTRLEEMVQSVKEFGVIMPLVIWNTEAGEHFILSGHNRSEAAKLAGLTQVPVVIRENLTMEEATLIVTETNLRQRSFSDLSYSERAHCLKQHYDATKEQGKRLDLLGEFEKVWHPESDQEEPVSLRERLAKESEISSTTFARYVKIASLPKPLLDLLDQGDLSFMTAYSLSFLTEEKVLDCLAEHIESGYSLSAARAKELRTLCESVGAMSIDVLEEFLLPTSSPPQKLPSRKISLSPQLLQTYFSPEQSTKEIEEILEKALLDYFKK